jgi:hypothetical protein
MAEPYCLAMVLCDAVYTDATTGKRTLLGTFSTLTSHEYPANVRLAVYHAITDADGEFTVTFRIVDSKHLFDDDTEPVFSVDISGKCHNPLAVLEGAIQTIVQLPEPGVYHCELLCGGNVLMSRRLVALRFSDVEGMNE